MDRSIEIPIASLAETEAFGRRLGRLLFPGAVVALIGPLGAGKTHLVRAIAEGLEIRNVAAVSSPTFVLIQEYEAKYTIYHFDAYRLKGAPEFEALGAAEYVAGDGVCLIEWADRVSQCLPEQFLSITIHHIDEHQRKIHINAIGKQYVDIIESLQRL